MATATTTAFRSVPRTGVIYVMHRAEQAGYGRDGRDWYNLGQGSPEVGPLPGAPPRVERLEIDPRSRSYAPVGGLHELRERIAAMYNERYRRGLPSQYSVENVSIAPGGRAAMTRVAAALGPMNLGHFIPDYTAYEELLFTFRGFIPIPILVRPSEGYRISCEELEREIVGRGLSAVLCSNPSNPTGTVVQGEELANWLALARVNRCAMIFDEFYSHYVFEDESGSHCPGHTVSAAAYVEDVDEDPVVLVDGLTKNWRYPGWRISWIVGPKTVIEQATSAGSFLDGGANHPFQQATLELLGAEDIEREAVAIQSVFRGKREYMLERLSKIGIQVEPAPCGSFYAWGNLAELPEGLQDGLSFFESALQRGVITVPGAFFDVNPGRRRLHARYVAYSRFSFGPELEKLAAGLDRIEQMVASAR